ncbi:MAG: 1-acyl-sn-glycerol-3-phosphate acyltransferase, partial [Mycobacterium sp.]|nr:1-acyl-sn-glycerol-3-phosphate acyltransferase [Mycobacterium sp.]
VRFGEPMDFSRFDGLAGNRFIERAVIDEVMYELMKLSGQEYVDIYAATIKQGDAAVTPAEADPPDVRIPQTAAG